MAVCFWLNARETDRIYQAHPWWEKDFVYYVGRAAWMAAVLLALCEGAHETLRLWEIRRGETRIREAMRLGDCLTDLLVTDLSLEGSPQDEWTVSGRAVFTDMVFRPRFHDVDSERDVVLEEIAMVDDNPSDLVHDKAHDRHYNDRARQRVA